MRELTTPLKIKPRLVVKSTHTELHLLSESLETKATEFLFLLTITPWSYALIDPELWLLVQLKNNGNPTLVFWRSAFFFSLSLGMSLNHGHTTSSLDTIPF